MRVSTLVSIAVPAAGLAVLLGIGQSAGSPPVDAAARQRCATRLSMSLTGKAPSAELAAAADPQAQVDALLADPAFIEQFSRFVNSELNPEPADTTTPQQDATYYLAKHVLTNNRPWRELFDGPYNVMTNTSTTPPTVSIVDDPNGLGYFRSRPWMVRYAGNEEQGYRLSSAFRIQQNIIGLDVTAVTTAPDVDISATGRMASGCAGCHYDPYFALDKVAKILSKRDITNTTGVSFIPPTEGPQQILGGKTIANDKELVEALIDSTDHKFRVCRMAFQYLYGRPEASCEAPLFDACIDAYTQTGDIRAALKTIATDPGYCE